MLKYILNDQESKVISLSEKHNEEELLGWKIPNVFFPLCVIIFSLFAYWILIPKDKFDWITFFNLLVNGSVLMAAFNRMSSMISYYSKIDFTDSKRLGINIRNVRMKIMIYSFFLILGIALVYSNQVINKPFNDGCVILFQFILSALLFWFSIDATKIAFLLQEAFLKNTYELAFRLQMQSVTQTPPTDDIQF
jgi:hypothetical protein